MPDVTSSTYNSNNELIDKVGGGLPSIAPDPSLTPNQNVTPDSFFQGMGAIATNDNPWLKNNFLNTPLNVKVSDTERYQDPQYGYNPYNPNIETQYGDRQGFAEKWKNNLIKFGGNLIGSFTESLATIPLAINAIASGNLSSMEDNKIVNGISEWQARLENDHPNYETTYGKEHPFLDYIPFVGHSGDSWGGVLKNLGYTAGAIAGSLVQDVAIGSVTEGLGELPLIGGQLTKIFTSLGKVLNGSEDTYKAYIEAKNAGMPIVNAIERAAATAKVLDKVRYNMALLTSSTSEAMVEANQSMNDVSTQLKKEYYDKHGYEAAGSNLDEIKNYSLSSGNATLLSNIALLTLTNSIQFGSLLKPANAAKAALEASVDDGLRIGLKKGTLDILEGIPDIKSGLKGILKKFTTSEGVESFATEGFEEGSQYVIQQTADKYYTRKYDQKSIDEVDNFVDSISKGLHDVFTTREGLENILIGGLSGAIIHPARLLINKFRGVESEKKQRLAQTLELLNNNPITGLFDDKYNSAVNSFNISTNASEKLKGGDLYGYKNEKFLQLFDFVNAGIKTHRFEGQLERLNMIKDLPFKEQASLLGIKDDTTTKEMLDRYVDSTIAKASEIKSDIEKVNGAFKNKINYRKSPETYNLFESYKSEIAVSISQLRDNKKRIQSVGDEVRKITPFVDINKVVNLTTDEGLTQTVKDFTNRIKELSTDEQLFTDAKKLSEIKDERKLLEDHIADINRLSNRNSNFQNQVDENGNITNQDVKDLQLPLVHDILNYYANGMDKTKDEIDQIDAISIFNKSQDIAKLYGDVSNLTKYYKVLLDKKGFAEFSKSENALIEKRKVDNPIDKVLPVDVVPPEEADKAEPEDIDETKDTTDTDKTAANEKVKPTDVKNEPFDPDAADAQMAEDAKDKAKGKKGKTDAEVKEALKREAAKAAAGDDLLNAQEDKKDLENEKQRALAENASKFDKASPEEVAALTKEKEQLIKDYDAKIAELENKIKELTTVKEKLDKEATPVEIKASKGTRKYEFNPINYFYRVFSQDYTNGGNEKTNVTDAIMKKTKQYIYDALGLKITDSVKNKGMSFGEYKLMSKDNPELYNTGYAHDMTLNIEGKPVGKIQPANRFAFKRGDKFLPLIELTKEEYTKVTKNSIDTYDEFITDLKLYDEAVNKLLDEYKNGKTEFTNAEIKKIFNIAVSYGNIRYANSPMTSTNLSDITYNKPGNVVISLPMVGTERSNESTVIGKENLTPEQHVKLLTFMSNNIDFLKGLNRRYLFIAQLPNGEYDRTSVIAARPTTLDEASTKEMFKLLSSSPKVENVDEVNAKLKDLFYIADAGTTVKGTNINFEFNKDGKLYIKINNNNVEYIKNGQKQLGYNRRIPVLNAEKATSLNELLTRVNSNIQFQKLKDKGLEKLNIELTKNNVKNGILSDENVTFASLSSKLSVAVQPGKDGKTSNIFENPSLNLIPLNKKAPKADTVKKETTKTETKPVVTPAEAKTSTKAAENFIKDKDAKEKARNEAKGQTIQQVEDDFLNSLGCK